MVYAGECKNVPQKCGARMCRRFGHGGGRSQLLLSGHCTQISIPFDPIPILTIPNRVASPEANWFSAWAVRDARAVRKISFDLGISGPSLMQLSGDPGAVPRAHALA